MNDTSLTHLSVLTALNQMMRGRHFSICVVRDAVKALGTVPDSRALAILADENLRAWCQKHHLRYDAEHHAQTAYATRRERANTQELF